MATVINDDCVSWLRSKRGDKRFDFAFLDPPFNIGQKYSGHVDKMPDHKFGELITSAVVATWDSLSENGVMALHGPDNLCERYLAIAWGAGMRRIAWINWHYRFGVCQRHNWIDSRCHCLIYAKSESYTWNPDAVLVESDRVAYGDKRVDDHANGGKRLPFTIWGIPSDGEFWGRVQGTNHERVPGNPNQLPERYIERLILAYTNPGDSVLDPFGGTGTTAVVAESLGREATTIDISAANCLMMLERLKRGPVHVGIPYASQITKRRRKRDAVDSTQPQAG